MPQPTPNNLAIHLNHRHKFRPTQQSHIQVYESAAVQAVELPSMQRLADEDCTENQQHFVWYAVLTL